MTDNKEAELSDGQHSFQAEIKQLLDLMVHSMYSNAEVFLRELVSNSSDALDRLRFEQSKDASLKTADELCIRLTVDEKERTLTLEDNGIGMTRSEVAENLGTIARSGTKEFMKAIKEKSEAGSDLIGQFGVGFYSSFIVANEVEVLTKRAGEEEAVRWISKGDGTYELESAHKDSAGTRITLHLKEASIDDAMPDFTKEYVLREIVKKHSDFVSYPIQLEVERPVPKAEDAADDEKDDEKDDDKEPEMMKVWETLNSMKAIWTKNKDDLEEEELEEFYRHISHDWQKPLGHIPVKMEGTVEASALLFLPKTRPMDLFHPEMKRGVQLYVKRVFIMDECKDLLPDYLRFVKGVVDAQDLSLNVSREILQKNRQVLTIRKQLVKKVLDKLKELRVDDRAAYEELWTEFGLVLKEGLLSADEKEKKRLFETLLFTSTYTRESSEASTDADAGDAENKSDDEKKNVFTSLAEYIERMQEGQEEIYVLTGTNLDSVEHSPHLEAVKSKNFEVLLLVDPIDELWLNQGLEYDGKKFVNVADGGFKIDADDEKEEEKPSEDQAKWLNALQASLSEHVKEVRLSKRLTTSAACLVGDEGEMTAQMAALLKQMGKEVPKVKRILEINPEHALVGRLSKLDTEKDQKNVDNTATLLFGAAILAEGGMPPDPAKLSSLMTDLLGK
ncbi:MAG: molecular chaperone HtpG [Deltaproteobacteria bacterium]|nr:molecular chaperone HtpG [Deltaproteobacteria bacterium]